MDLCSDESGAISIDDLRSRLFKLCLFRNVLATSLIGFFWAAYSWIIIFVVLTLTTGGIGMAHFASLESLYHSHCCCAPRSAVVFLVYTSIINLPLSVICTLSCIFATSSSEGRGRTFAAISLLICVLLSICECMMLIMTQRLRRTMESDQEFGFASNQISPEIVGNGRGDGEATQRPSVVRVLVDPVGGLVLDEANNAVYVSDNRLPSRHRDGLAAVEGDAHELQYVIGQPVYGIPVVSSHVAAAGANGCPTGEGSSVSTSTTTDRLPSFVTTSGTLGYAPQLQGQ